ncbi:FRG1-like family-domain-containing protein [Powellomyces hirtus]|nr:FRG1-like family-domain-containing protein [Powellomyces hirtus]
MKRTSKLSFKGDSGIEKKKRKKRKAEPGNEESSTGPQDGWITIDSIDDIKGPIIFLSSATEPASVLTCSETSSKVSFTSLSPDSTFLNYEPASVAQVFVAKRLPDSAKISFRSSFDRYLGTDKFGIVSCEREAMGPAEEWEVVLREDGAALQSSFDKFLKCGEDAAARADSEVVGFREVFQIRCQAANKYRSKKAKSEKELDIAAMELEQIKKSHSWGGGRLILSQEDTLELKKAKREGQLNEALLDRRAKLKSDKFCK